MNQQPREETMTAATLQPLADASLDAAARRVRALLRPRAFPHPVARLEMRETHISWVILTGEFAYKIKKPVRLGFLDASTLHRRHQLCEAEVQLNRRFAPGLYLDVVPIVDEPDGPAMGGAGVPVEYAVRMRQFDPAQELAQLLERDAVTVAEARDLGLMLATVHTEAGKAEAASPYGGYELIAQQARDNFRALRAARLEESQRAVLQRLSEWTQRTLHELHDVFLQRKAEGAVRQCHGDLHARNVVRLPDRWIAYDCIEFDPALSWIDVMCDLAFLYMDLLAHARGDLASACLGSYLERTGDYDGLAVLRFYAVYRALVRAKVDALAVHTAAESRDAWRARLASRLDAANALSQTRRPTLIVMHGVTASGKTRVSEQLIALLEAVRVRSDLERKRLQGVDPLAQRGAPVGAGPYSPEATRATYDAVHTCAAHALRAGFNTIADATFLMKAERDSFRDLAASLNCGFVIVACQADTGELRRRVAARRQSRPDASEADEAVLSHQLAVVEPLDEAEKELTVVLNTGDADTVRVGIEIIRRRVLEAGTIEGCH